MRQKLRGVSVTVAPALLWVSVLRLPAHHADALSHTGSILAAIATVRGSTQSSEVLAIQRGAIRTLLRWPRGAMLSVAPSPDGRRVAFLGCCSAASAGVWAFNRDGTHLHRVVRLPPSPCSNPLAAGSLSWSPGGRRLAYILYIPSDAIRGCPPGIHDATGVWVTPFDRPRPRQVAFDLYAQTSPPLSWSRDGRALAINSGMGGARVRALDLATGASKPLARGGFDGIYAPVTGALAYVTSGPSAARLTHIWVAGAEGQHRYLLASTTLALAESPLRWSPSGRNLAYLTDTGTPYRRGARTLAVPGTIASHPRTLVTAPDGALDFPVWSPDGQSIAYSGVAPCACQGTSTPGTGPAIFTVDVATGVRHVLATPRQLLAGVGFSSDLTSIAWTTR